MSGGWIATLVVVGYVALGVGTARAILGMARRYAIEHSAVRNPDYWTYRDPDVTLPAIFGGVFWPVAWVYLVVLRPVITVVGPWFGRWFLAPYHRAGQR